MATFPLKTFFFNLCKLQLYGANPSNYGHHEEGQNDQECPLSSRRLLMVIFKLNTLCIIFFFWEIMLIKSN